MNSLEGIRSVVDNDGVKWLAVIDIAKKIGRDNASLRLQIQKNYIVFKTIEWERTGRGNRQISIIKETDVYKVLASLRVTGEFANSFKHIKESVMNKGLEAIKPKAVKHFQRFPDPIQIPEKPIRASVVEYIRKVAIVTKTEPKNVFRSLYTEFKYRFNIDLSRHAGFKTGIDKCAELEKLLELYSLARRMFDEYMPEENILPEAEENYDKLPPTCN